MGRAVIKVQVSPAADPEHVMQLLLQCAEDHPSALKVPAPFTSFDNFTGTELHFTVGATVADVYSAGKVASELRVKVLMSLRENGVQLANPQQDVHLKDLDWIKATATKLAEQRSNTGQRPPAAPSPSADLDG
jgi:small-conductance mechanosensitive channel